MLSMSSGNSNSPSLQEIHDKLREAVQTKPTTELAINAGAGALRAAHMANLILRQKNVMYADGQRLSLGANIGHGITLALVALGLYTTGTEIARRAAGIQPPRSRVSRTKLDPARVAVESTAIGLSLAEVKNGRTLIKKRALSTYGRVYQTLSSGAATARLALHIRAAM